MKELIGKQGLWYEGDLTLVRIESIESEDVLKLRVKVLAHAEIIDGQVRYLKDSKKIGKSFNLMGRDWYPRGKHRFDIRYIGKMLLNPAVITLFLNQEPRFAKIWDAQDDN